MIGTNLEQSRHLLELGLGTATADMCLCKTAQGTWSLCAYIPGEYDAHTVPAWSLDALLDVASKEKTSFVDCRFLYSTCDGRGNHLDKVWCVSFDDIDGIGKDIYNKDKTTAAYEIVCWLLENNLIKKGDYNEERS